MQLEYITSIDYMYNVYVSIESAQKQLKNHGK